MCADTLTTSSSQPKGDSGSGVGGVSVGGSGIHTEDISAFNSVLTPDVNDCPIPRSISHVICSTPPLLPNGVTISSVALPPTSSSSSSSSILSSTSAPSSITSSTIQTTSAILQKQLHHSNSRSDASSLDCSTGNNNITKVDDDDDSNVKPTEEDPRSEISSDAMDDLNSSNSNDVDILTGGVDCLVVEAHNTFKKQGTNKYSFSIEQLADPTTSTPNNNINIINSNINRGIGQIVTSSFARIDVDTLDNNILTKNVQLEGPDGPISISIMKEDIKDEICVHRKLDFNVVKNASGKHGKTGRHEVVYCKTGGGISDTRLTTSVKVSASSESVDEDASTEYPGLVDRSDSSSSSSCCNSDTAQYKVPHGSRLKMTRRMKRKAKVKRNEARRRWLEREKKVLFSGLESNHRPVTRSLDKSIKANHQHHSTRHHHGVSGASSLKHLDVDCDSLNVDCVDIGVSDVDCRSATFTGKSTKHEGGGSINTDNHNVICNPAFSSTASTTNLNKENISISIEADGILEVSDIKDTISTLCDTSNADKSSNRSFSKRKPARKYTSISPLALFTMPPLREKGKQTRTTLTLQEKVKVIEAFLDGKSQRQIAQMHGIGKTQVSGIIKRREEILSTYRGNIVRGEKLTSKRHRKSEYSLLNEHVIKWYRHMACNTKITTGMLRAKALQIAPQLGYHDFKASNGWLATFKGNNNLKFSRAASGNRTNRTEQSPIRDQQPLAEDTSYFEEADVETNTTEEDETALLAVGGEEQSIIGGGGGVTIRGGGGIGVLGDTSSLGGVGPCAAGFLASPGLLQGAAAAAILKCGVSVTSQGSSGNLAPPQLPMEAFHLSRSAAVAGGGMVDHNTAAHHHHHHHHHATTTAAAGAATGGPPPPLPPPPLPPPPPSSLALAAAGKGGDHHHQQSSVAVAAAAAAAGVLGYKSEEPPLGYGGGGYDHHHHHQLGPRMTDQLAPPPPRMPDHQLSTRMTDHQLSTRMTDHQLSTRMTDHQLSTRMTDHQLSSRMTDHQLATRMTSDQLPPPRMTSDQLTPRMTADQLTPRMTSDQLSGRGGMAGDQLTGRMGDGGTSSAAVATAASSSAAAAAVAAAARTSEYNYAPYTFPSGYYGYHFLGQY